MKVLKTTDNGDFYISNGKYAFLYDVDAVALICENVMKTQVGTLPLALQRGIDYFDNVFSGSPNFATFEAEAREQIGNVEGVVSITSFEMEFEDETLSYEMTISTDYGETTISSSESIETPDTISSEIPTPPETISTGLRQLLTSFDADTMTMIDEAGLIEPVKVVKSPCLYFSGIETLDAIWLTGSETVTTRKGTAFPTISAGSISFSAGTLYNFTLSTGHHFHCGETSGATLYNDAVDQYGEDLTITDNGTTTAVMWETATQSVYHSFLAWGGRLSSGVYIPALDDGSLCADGNAIELNGGFVLSPCPSKFVQVDPLLLGTPSFWSADGLAFDEKEYSDFTSHVQSESALFVQWNQDDGGECVGDKLAQYFFTQQFSYNLFSLIIDWASLNGMTCGAWPTIITNNAGINLVVNGGGLVYSNT